MLVYLPQTLCSCRYSWSSSNRLPIGLSRHLKEPLMKVLLSQVPWIFLLPFSALEVAGYKQSHLTQRSLLVYRESPPHWVPCMNGSMSLSPSCHKIFYDITLFHNWIFTQFCWIYFHEISFWIYLDEILFLDKFENYLFCLEFSICYFV